MLGADFSFLFQGKERTPSLLTHFLPLVSHPSPSLYSCLRLSPLPFLLFVIIIIIVITVRRFICVYLRVYCVQVSRRTFLTTITRYIGDNVVECTRTCLNRSVTTTSLPRIIRLYTVTLLNNV